MFEKKINSYLSELKDLLDRIDTSLIQKFIEELQDTRLTGHTVFIAGNGGSAVTASHIANDFGDIVLKKKENVPPLRALSLTDNNAFFSAIANDYGYSEVFVNQLKVHYREGDKLIVISASGKSSNVIEAAKWVKSKNGKVIGLLGFDGGDLKNFCDIPIVVETPKGKYGLVEDVHMILNHIIANWFFSLAK